METSRTGGGVQQTQTLNPKTESVGEEEQRNGSSRKRKSDDDSRSPKTVYFKLRATVRDLRPHFFEVLQTPEFRDCKAVPHIRKQMKTMLELCRLLGMEPASNEHQTADPKVPSKEEAESNKAAKAGANSEAAKTVSEEQHIKGSYIIGGSPPHGNFVLYHSTSSDPVFYGVTKEAWSAKLLQKSESKQN